MHQLFIHFCRTPAYSPFLKLYLRCIIVIKRCDRKKRLNSTIWWRFQYITMVYFFIHLLFIPTSLCFLVLFACFMSPSPQWPFQRVSPFFYPFSAAQFALFFRLSWGSVRRGKLRLDHVWDAPGDTQVLFCLCRAAASHSFPGALGKWQCSGRKWSRARKRLTWLGRADEMAWFLL